MGKEKMTKRRSSTGLALSAAIALGVGYVAGILTAPKSGKETRKEIERIAKQTKAASERKLKKLHSELTIQITKASVITANAGTKLKQELAKALKSAERAKEKARRVLSALHEGEADNKDLDKAIKEIDSALKHLKLFIKSDEDKKTS